MVAQIQNIETLKSTAEKFVYSLQIMNIAFMDAFLLKEFASSEFDKEEFLRLINRTLDDLKSSGDSYLNKFEGFCNSEICQSGCYGFRFVGNSSQNYFDLILKTQNGYISNLTFCNSFSCKMIRVNRDVNKSTPEIPF